MNKISKYIGIAAFALCGSMLLASCDDDLAQAPIVQPVEEIGDGTWQNPMQTWQANLGSTVGDRTTNWVTGYIVGWIETSISNTMSGAKICYVPVDGEEISPDDPFAEYYAERCATNTNMIIAQYPFDAGKWAEMGYSLDDCATVQLPSGVVRTALNLQDNWGNFNKQVSLRGTTGSKYCGQYGVRSANDYNWGPIGRYEEPLREIAGSYYCDFTASRDINYYIERGWSSYMISGGLSGWYWKENSGIDFMSISAYLGSANGGPYENWLVSPGLNLDEAEYKTVSFSTQSGNAADSSLEVYVMTHKNPKACEPVKLECVLAKATGTSYTSWVKSGTIDLSEFSGTVYIGFRYWSAHGGAGNSADYGVTNFNFGNADPADWEVIDPATLSTFRRVDRVESGHQYVFVFGNKMVLPLASSSRYGNFGVKNVRKSDDTISVPRDYAFTLTESEDNEGQFTVQDYLGRYIYMTGTYTNFNVWTPAEGWTPTADMWWSFTAEGGLFKILSIKRNMVMIYDASKDYISSVAPSKFIFEDGAEIYELEE